MHPAAVYTIVPLAGSARTSRRAGHGADGLTGIVNGGASRQA